jgi:SAM-dependent methyltransferase
MIDNDKHYFINFPVFIKFKDKFNFLKMERERKLKILNVNERIVEVPFVINALVKQGGNIKVLDLGCAESLMPLYLSSLNYDVTGLDCRDYPYMASNFKFEKGDILNLPFSDCSFDTVLCVSTLEHIGIGFYNDPVYSDGSDQKAIKEMNRVLKNDGQLILTVPFGVKRVNEQQRVYDLSSLEEILNDFSIKELRFFSNERKEGAVCNYWKEVSAEQAAKVHSPGFTQCTCCLTAVKK